MAVSAIPNRRIYTQDVLDENGNIDPELLLYVLNTFMEAVYVLFDGNIEFGTNISAQIRDLSFNTPTDYTGSPSGWNNIDFGINIKGRRPSGVFLGRIREADNINAVFTDPVTISWQETTEGVRINYITGLKDDTSYIITVVVI
jgi:hypothetical protein